MSTPGRRSRARTVEPLIRVDDDFEDEYPGATALATECYANVIRAGDLLVGLHSRQMLDDYRLSQSALQILAIIEGARGPLEPTVIAERLLVTTGTLTSLLDNLERRALIRRQPHPRDRRKLLVDITPAAQAIVDGMLPSLHAREQNVISAALSVKEQRELRRLIAMLQQSALEARDAPSPRGAARQRRWARTEVDAPPSNPGSP
jgi:DNA-binding MarR family transcriptional regulator